MGKSYMLSWQLYDRSVVPVETIAGARAAGERRWRGRGAQTIKEQDKEQVAPSERSL